MKIEPNVGYGLRGWKARQEAAKRKMAGGKNSAERQQVREIRKRHREGLERGEPTESTPEELAVEASVHAEPDVAPPETEKPVDEPVSDSLPDPDDMDREELIAELQALGEKVHPASKDETLRRKVRDAR